MNGPAILVAIVLSVLGTIALSAIMALPVMWLWNGVVPNLFVGGTLAINFWNAWGLAILCGLLFKTHVSTKD